MDESSESAESTIAGGSEQAKVDSETIEEPNGQDLEGILPNLKARADELGVDRAEYVSSYLAKHPLTYKEKGNKANRGNSGDDDSFLLSEDTDLSRLISLEHTREKSQPYDTYDGAVVIVYHRDEETGKVYFSFEKKPETHPLKGKLALYGGTVRVGETYNEALPRELKEEDPRGYDIILDALRNNGNNGYYFTEVSDYVDGVPSTTKFWVAEIEDPSKWEVYTSTKSTEGDKTILSYKERSLEKMIDTILKDFAYPPQAQVVIDFIRMLHRLN